MNYKILTILMLAVVSLSACYLLADSDGSEASTVVSGTYTDTVTNLYTFNVDNGDAIIVSYAGANDPATLDIPSSVSDGTNTYTVTTIGNGTNPIVNKDNFTTNHYATLTIPNTITAISARAFYNDSGSNSYLNGDLIIPDTVTSMGDRAFAGQNRFSTLTLSQNISALPDYVFRGCYSLNGVLEIPDSVTSIGIEAFRNCTSLTSVTIPDSVTSIGQSGFASCSSLTGVTIPDSVTSIGNGAFTDCTGATTLLIEGSPTSIGNNAFNMSALETVYNLGENDTIVAGAYGIPSTATVLTYYFKYILSGITTIITKVVGNVTSSLDIPATIDGHRVNVVGRGSAIIQNSQLSSGATLTIPDGVTTIGSYAFNSCTGFTSVTIPDSVTTIGVSVFWNCTGLTNVDLGESIISIPSDAFHGCSSLTSITIPDSVTSIGNYAFQDCTSLTSVTIPDNVTSIGSNAFLNCSGLTSVDLGEGVTSIGLGAFNGCSSLTSLDLGGGVQILENGAFYNCSSLTSVTIPDSVTTIGDGAFRECTSLTSLDLGGGVQTIGREAFRSCTSLTSVAIPDSVTNIGENAFNSCSSLTSITIPDGVISIGNYAFYGCNGVTTLINLSSATFGSDSLNMSNVSEVLNLGDTELNPGSYGLPSTCTVKTEIDADSYIAPAMIKESHDKEGAVYTIIALLPLFIILGALVMCATTIVRKN